MSHTGRLAAAKEEGKSTRTALHWETPLGGSCSVRTRGVIIDGG